MHLPGSSLGTSLPQPVKQRWPQDSIRRAVCAMLPEGACEGVKFPFIEDLVNTEPFTEFPKFVELRSGDADAPLGPTVLGHIGRGQRAAVEGVQRGAFFHGEAVPQLIPLGPKADAHFDTAVRDIPERGLPFDRVPLFDYDLMFAVSSSVRLHGSLEVQRSFASGAMEALSARLQPLSGHLRRLQRGHVASISRRVHIALIAALWS